LSGKLIDDLQLAFRWQNDGGEVLANERFEITHM
jgi:hypothetical protein